MNIRVIYSTQAFLDKNDGQPAKQSELWFATLEEAKAAPLPKGYVSAFISVEAGRHVYSQKFGWEYHKIIESRIE
jgi:hypothetical protein